jgi:hypothetical protein
MAEKIHTFIFWFMIPCSLVGSYQHSDGTCSLYHQDTTDLYSQNPGSMLLQKLYHLPDNTVSQPTGPQL